MDNYNEEDFGYSVILYWDLVPYEYMKQIIENLDMRDENIRIYDEGIVIFDILESKASFLITLAEHRGLTSKTYNIINNKYKKKYKLDIADSNIMKKYLSDIKIELNNYLIDDISKIGILYID